MDNQPNFETDPRFPSGPWTGFFLMKHLPGKHVMELSLAFQQGVMTGEGRDFVGEFIIRGQYTLDDGKCWWSKRYIGMHDVFYSGYNEGKGIWGTWEILGEVRNHGGFHIWPVGMGDPTGEHLYEHADVPAPQEELIGVGMTSNLVIMLRVMSSRSRLPGGTCATDKY